MCSKLSWPRRRVDEVNSARQSYKISRRLRLFAYGINYYYCHYNARACKRASLHARTEVHLVLSRSGRLKMDNHRHGYGRPVVGLLGLASKQERAPCAKRLSQRRREINKRTANAWRQSIRSAGRCAARCASRLS